MTYDQWKADEGPESEPREDYDEDGPYCSECCCELDPEDEQEGTCERCLEELESDE